MLVLYVHSTEHQPVSVGTIPLPRGTHTTHDDDHPTGHDAMTTRAVSDVGHRPAPTVHRKRQRLESAAGEDDRQQALDEIEVEVVVAQEAPVDERADDGVDQHVEIGVDR